MLPILYQNHDLVIFSYPLLMGLGWGVAYQLFHAHSDLNRLHSQILYWGLFLSAWIGSKVLFLMTAAPENLSSTEVSFWLGGGFVFYGGVIAGILFLLTLKMFSFKFTKKTINALILSLVFGHAIGRIGCFLAGCCFGSETDLAWGIHLHGADRHPTQLIEAFSLLFLGVYFLKIQHTRFLLPLYLFAYGLLRFFLEMLRGDEVRGSWAFWTPGQWISVILVSYGIYLLLNRHKTHLELN